jgi:hypothetical protein
MGAFQADQWLPVEQQKQLVSQLMKRVGLTRVRAECFVRLWIYLLVKEIQAEATNCQPPLTKLTQPKGAVICTLKETAELFYNDKEQGSERSAGMMLDKLAALGLIHKYFDGNTTQITIQNLLEELQEPAEAELAALKLDNFDPRCDAIPVANLLAKYYNWMNRNTEALPYRISRWLREWAKHYAQGMRVLRRCDNLNPVGFYLLYPTACESEPLFFGSASKGLHLSGMTEVDPFKVAILGDLDCVSVFARSWVIEPVYLEQYRTLFLEDAQQTLKKMRQDFPNLCDLYTMIIHPSYEEMALAMGFQKTDLTSQLSVYWMYLALDRFLNLDISSTFPNHLTGRSARS